MMLRLLFFGILVFTCIIETQDALFTDGRSLQDVRKYSNFYSKYSSNF
jgi:hypothetical protein